MQNHIPMKNERGATKVEYALLLSCLLAVVLPSTRFTGTQSAAIFLRAGTTMGSPSLLRNPTGDPNDGGDTPFGETENASPGAPEYGGGTQTTTPGEQHGVPEGVNGAHEEEIGDGGSSNSGGAGSGVGNNNGQGGGSQPMGNRPRGRVRPGRIVQQGRL